VFAEAFPAGLSESRGQRRGEVKRIRVAGCGTSSVEGVQQVSRPTGCINCPAIGHATRALSTLLGAVVTMSTQLPVRLVPEETRITTERKYVVNHGCLHPETAARTQRTVWMLCKVRAAQLAPLDAITTFAGATSHCFAPHSAPQGERRADRTEQDHGHDKRHFQTALGLQRGGADGGPTGEKTRRQRYTNADAAAHRFRNGQRRNPRSVGSAERTARTMLGMPGLAASPPELRRALSLGSEPTAGKRRRDAAGRHAGARSERYETAHLRNLIASLLSGCPPSRRRMKYLIQPGVVMLASTVMRGPTRSTSR
jgi:hypothetical protein